jgi:hypothetical protein
LDARNSTMIGKVLKVFKGNVPEKSQKDWSI